MLDMTMRLLEPVLDKGWVEVQAVFGEDLWIVNAARVSFLGESKGEESDEKLLRYLLKNEHTSPFEQVCMKFRIKAPLVVWWQIVRHRTAKLNMQSGRYVAFEEDEMYVPETWRLQSASNKQGSDGTVDEATNQMLTDRLLLHYEQSMELYELALDNGVAKEQARLFLPGFSMYYVGVWTMDVHNLMHFLKLRLDPHAQEEIRVYAEAIYGFFAEAFPMTCRAFDEFVLVPRQITP